MAASSDNLGSLEISVREPKNAVEIIRQLNLPYPDEKFWKTADYQVILISSQGKHYEVRKRVRVSEAVIEHIITSESYKNYPRGFFKGKPDGYVSVNLIKLNGEIKAVEWIEESFDRDDVSSFTIKAEDSVEGKRLANQGARTFHLPMPFPEYG